MTSKSAAAFADNNFIVNLNNFIESELHIVQRCDVDSGSNLSKERYVVFKQAFNKVINYAEIYKSLLSNIKREYEQCIDALERKQLERSFLKTELPKLDFYPDTIINLEKRKNELIALLEKTRSENDRLLENCNKLIAENAKFRPKPVDKYSFLNVNKHPDEINGGAAHSAVQLIPGISLEKATDFDYLCALLTKVESKVNELTASQAKYYSSKKQKQELQEQLFEKMNKCDELRQEGQTLKNKLLLYKLAMSAAQEFYSGNSRYTSIQDALSKKLVNIYLNKQSKTDDDAAADDGILETEAEILLDYIEHFNDMFEHGKYTEAAYYAASSPRNILRNIETLLRFKAISDASRYVDEEDPLLIYCNCLVDSIDDAAATSNSKPNELMSIESVRVALRFDRLDLLTRWIAQRRLTFSRQLARMIEEHTRRQKSSSVFKNLNELALFIYTDIKSLHEAAVCHAKLGRFSSMMDFVDKSDPSERSNIALQILKECPTVELANAIMIKSKSVNRNLVERIVSVLLESNQVESALQFLRLQIDKKATKEETSLQNDNDISKFNASYEMLMRFSFLAQNDDQFTKEIALESRNQVQHLFSSALLKFSEKQSNSSSEHSNETSETGLSLTQSQEGDNQRKAKFKRSLNSIAANQSSSDTIQEEHVDEI